MKASAHLLFFVGAGLFALAYSAAYNLLQWDELALSPAAVIMAAAFALLVLYGLCFLLGKSAGRQPERGTEAASPMSLRLWAGAFLALAAVYSLCLLAYFPGPAVNDSLMIYRNGMMMANASPVLYCVFVSVFAKLGQWLGSAQLGVAACNIFQMLMVCGMSAWVICWVFAKRLHRWVKAAVGLYYALNPLLIMYSFTMIKDTLFSLAVVLLFLVSYDLIMENRGTLQRWLVLAADVLLLISFRNGVIYMMAVYIVVLAFTVKDKGLVKRAAAIVLVCVAGVALLCAALEKRFDIEYYSKEMLAIPIQQLSAVVASDGELTPEQQEIVAGMMSLEDIREKYVPYHVDAIKWDLAFSNSFVNENTGDILKVWLEAMPENREIYTKAWLWQTFWFWAPLQQGEVKIFETVVDLDPHWHAQAGVVDAPLLPEPLGEAVRDFCSLGCFFLREGVLFWLMLLCMLELYALRGDGRIFAVYAICLFQWLVLMVSTPVFHSIRYVLSYAYGLPVFFALLFAAGPGPAQGKAPAALPAENEQKRQGE